MITRGTVIGGVLLALGLILLGPSEDEPPAPRPAIEQNAGPVGSVG